MRQGKDPSKGIKLSLGPFVVIFTLLALVFASVFIFSPAPENPKTVSPVQAVSASEENITAVVESAEAIPQDTPAPAPGTLLESGHNLNDNYYKRFDFTGAASNLVENSFVLGGEHPATDARTGQDHPGSLTIHYGANTVVKTAKLYYPADRYEIFMASAADLETSSDSMFEVILEDADASELWAKEIVVSTFVFD